MRRQRVGAHRVRQRRQRCLASHRADLHTPGRQRRSPPYIWAGRGRGRWIDAMALGRAAEDGGWLPQHRWGCRSVGAAPPFSRSIGRSAPSKRWGRTSTWSERPSSLPCYENLSLPPLLLHRHTAGSSRHEESMGQYLPRPPCDRCALALRRVVVAVFLPTPLGQACAPTRFGRVEAMVDRSAGRSDLRRLARSSGRAVGQLEVRAVGQTSGRSSSRAVGLLAGLLNERPVPVGWSGGRSDGQSAGGRTTFPALGRPACRQGTWRIDLWSERAGRSTGRLLGLVSRSFGQSAVRSDCWPRTR